MFHGLAAYYDPLTSAKDYRAEVDHLEKLVARFSRSGGTSWLDVACGTGKHLEHLRRHFDVAGVDASPAMLRFARRRVPGVPLRRGDMRTFRLGRSFDVVSCLFSAIGHLDSAAEVRAAFDNFERHLKPGGVLIVEPWIDPADYRRGWVHLVVDRGPKVSVARMAYSTRQGNRSRIDYHYLIGERGRGVRYVRELGEGLLVPRRRLVELLKRPGMSVRFLRPGLSSGRGLLIGVKSRTPPRAGSQRR